MRSTDKTPVTPPGRSNGIAAPAPASEPATQSERPSWPRIDSELAAETVGAPWNYPWELAPGIHAQAGDPLARQMAWVREAMIEPYVFDGLAMGAERVALDLDCGEGRMAQQLLAWGARRVVGVSDDPEALYRAALLRRHFAIGPTDLDLRSRADLEPSSEPDFDIVLAVPLAEDALIEIAATRCRIISMFECAGADADRVAAAALTAGFASVERVEPPTQAVPPFLLGEREILVARKAAER